MVTQNILSTHPSGPANLDALVDCINACFACEQCCTTCADACLGEDMVAQLRQCIRLNLDCADVCAATGRLLSRQVEPNGAVLRAQLEACEAVCRACADECDQHRDNHEHCAVCADCCRRCADACRTALQALPQATA